MDLDDQGTVCSEISTPRHLSQDDLDLESEFGNMTDENPFPSEEEQIARAMALHEMMKETDEGLALEDAVNDCRDG